MQQGGKCEQELLRIMMMIQLFREAQKGLLILRMGVSMNGELCTPARLALHKVVEGRSGDQFGASVVSIDDHRSCIGRKNRMSARWGTKLFDPRKSILCQQIGRRSIPWQRTFATPCLIT